ncbi:hypothetical protein DQ384_23460 [Sphaerisporangium album]|uniref:Uncharacterized protein n=1 Tax=Sphaerisporangium album TaxID=509200 RepID=A0A367FGA2_9ACTN|nr:hypothetical protein DQ384_23460 [Sphaerisporangium album]
MLGGAAFAVSVGVAWLDMTGFEQYVWFPSPVRSRQRSVVHLIGDAGRERGETSWASRCPVSRRR